MRIIWIREIKENLENYWTLSEMRRRSELRQRRKLLGKLTFMFITYELHGKCVGCSKSNVLKVGASCSASDHLIRKISSGACQESCVHFFK